jgi:hypothetical protein
MFNYFKWVYWNIHYYIKYDKNNRIKRKLFKEAFELARSVPGMGSLTIMFDPYKLEWKTRIDFSNNDKFECSHENINTSLKNIIQQFNNCAYRGAWDWED